MFAFLAAALLVSSSCIALEADLKGDGNIYLSVVESMEELKIRKLADKLGIHYTPNIIQRASSVCYEELGCFDKEGTFKHLKQLPEPPESVNTQFLLYTRKNSHDPQFLDYKKPDTILKSNINPSLPLKIITHGFGGKGNLTWVWQMKTALLEKYDVNIIVIDWSLGAKVPYYLAAAVNSELVGAQGAVLYYFIKDNLGINEDKLHLIGFSLGAHVVGFIGKRMQVLRGTKPARITGLDPASPLFEDYGGEVHLYKDDGEFVDVVHTNADLLIYGGVGIGKAIGHVDYFPNGGKRQPGCGSTIKGAIVDMFKGERERTCNHERAVHLFTDSILDPGACKYVSYRCSNYSDFEAAKCMDCHDSCGQMGYKNSGTGIFYLMTKQKKPFCAEVAKLTVQFPEDIKRSYGSIIITLVGGNGEKENVTLTEKDEKLTGGDKRVLAIPIDEVFQPLEQVQALYLRYNGWFTKGSETFGLASITIQDPKGNYLYKSCGEVTLNDQQYENLKETEGNC